MAAIVTDQFRILNASNFIDSVNSDTNSYYVFLSLPNASASVGFGRTSDWDTNPPEITDNIDYLNHVYDTMICGKKISSANVRRLIRRIDWVKGTRYDMYRHDYSVNNRSPNTNASRLYSANYYVMNSDYRVYICIDNGSWGTNAVTENPKGNQSQDEPTFTDLEPSKAGDSNDGYIWKYLFTVSPSDIIKFDSTEYIPLPNDWETSTNPSIRSVRESADSDINENQIKKVYIEKQGSGYSGGLGQSVRIIGDGEGGRASVDVVGGKIVNVSITSGGKGYSYGMLDLDSIDGSVGTEARAKLIPIIPPSKGHGYDLYKELGADKVLIYARFDDSSKDFPIDTKFAQVGILKNPKSYNSSSIFSSDKFSSVYAVKVNQITTIPEIGQKLTQNDTKYTGYTASYDEETKVLKYITDRSLHFNSSTKDQTDYSGISTGSTNNGTYESFTSNGGTITGGISIDTTFDTYQMTVENKVIDLGVTFTDGIALPEINKRTGDIIYLDNRPSITRDSRQKEDIKIILEF